jgi:hypothetical protein
MSKLKIFQIVFFSIILLLVTISGCYDNMNNNKSSIRYYNVTINTNETTHYELILPMPLEYNNNKKPEFLLKQPDIRGNIIIEYINSDHGKAISIIGNGSSNISYSSESFVSSQLYFSMREPKFNESGNNGNWMYSNTSETIILTIEMYSKVESNGICSDTREWITDYQIRNGWNVVKINSEAGSSD